MMPDTPAELIRLALKNLKLAEESPDYEIDTSEWHRYDRRRGITNVCLAGCLIAFTLNHNRKKNVEDPETLPDGFKILALNRIRSGDLEGAGAIWGAAKGANRFVTEYHKDRNKFVEDLTEIANQYAASNN